MHAYQVAYGSTATRLFTDSDPLREKSFGYFELEFDGASWRASLYRASNSEPGSLSRDFYGWNGFSWKPVGKDSQKYTNAPTLTGAYLTQVGTFQVCSQEPLAESLKNVLFVMLRTFPISTE